MEAAHFRATGTVVNLSEQQLVDCDTSNGGCNGGWYDGALSYAKDTGLTSGASYAYESGTTGAGGECLLMSRNFAIMSRLQSFTKLPTWNEPGMLNALANGPIAVAVSVFLDQS